MDTKKILIIGSVAVLGIGAYLYFKPKKSKGNQTGSLSGGNAGSIPSSPASSSGTTTAPNNTGSQSAEPNVKTLTEQEMQVITSLRDTILNDIRRKGTYKRSATRNAVQSDIDSNMQVLKSLGYTLDLNNNLVKIDK